MRVPSRLIRKLTVRPEGISRSRRRNLVDILKRLAIQLKNYIVNLEARLAGRSVVVHHDHLGGVSIFQMQRVDTVIIDLAQARLQDSLARCTA